MLRDKFLLLQVTESCNLQVTFGMFISTITFVEAGDTMMVYIEYCQDEMGTLFGSLANCEVS